MSNSPVVGVIPTGYDVVMNDEIQRRIEARLARVVATRKATSPYLWFWILVGAVVVIGAVSIWLK
jgi:hypothetical protein